MRDERRKIMTSLDWSVRIVLVSSGLCEMSVHIDPGLALIDAQLTCPAPIDVTVVLLRYVSAEFRGRRENEVCLLVRSSATGLTMDWWIC